MRMKTNLMKLTLFYQTFYKNIDLTRSNIGAVLDFSTENSPVIHVNERSFFDKTYYCGRGWHNIERRRIH